MAADRASLGLVLGMATAPAVGLLVVLLRGYGLADGWAQILYGAWGVAAVGQMLSWCS